MRNNARRGDQVGRAGRLDRGHAEEQLARVRHVDGGSLWRTAQRLAGLGLKAAGPVPGRRVGAVLRGRPVRVRRNDALDLRGERVGRVRNQARNADIRKRGAVLGRRDGAIAAQRLIGRVVDRVVRVEAVGQCRNPNLQNKNGARARAMTRVSAKAQKQDART